MITPHPTTPIDPKIARGVLVEISPQTATRPALCKVSFPNTSYELHMLMPAAVTGEPGKRILGTISARARRIDIVRTGGRYVEPVMGVPRRAQGLVVAVDPGSNTLVVNAGMPIHVTPTDPRQRAEQFEAGQFISFDLQEGVEFRQAQT